MKYYRLTYIFLLALYACDFSFGARIRNETDQSIEVAITYDKQVLDSVYQGRDYSRFVPEFTTMPASYNKYYDSANQRIVFTLPPHEAVLVDHGPTGYSVDKPDLGLFYSIKIRSSNREITYPAKSLDTLFRKVRRNEFELLVK